jgi:protein-tyrosine phosphatase
LIDLHCHMLPGIDDGAPDLATALEMAAIAVADGISLVACTPHIHPGRYENTAEGISRACDEFRVALAQAGIELDITYGADTQIVPDLLQGLQSGSIPTLHGSRYFLFEPSHHIPQEGMLTLLERLLDAGYVPVITHPERLHYIDRHYDQFLQAAAMGAWLQLTAGSVTGRFGARIQGVAWRFLRDGVTHLLATDAHNLKNRAPLLAEGRDVAATLVGEEEAERLVSIRPAAVIANQAPDEVAVPAVAMAGGSASETTTTVTRGWLGRIFRR